MADVSPTPTKENFRSCMAHCRYTKTQYAKIFGFLPHKFSIRHDGSEIYFLAPVSGVGNSLISVDVQGDHYWKMMSTPEKRRQLTRSEQLLRERMRASGVGITEYQYINSFDSNLVNTGNGCALYPCQLNETDQVINFPSMIGAMDYKLCPGDKNVLTCVSDGDIWMMFAQIDKPFQITNTKAFRPQEKITAGQSSFILQEEFDRYTGYWWDPSSGNGVYRILYEEVNETNVEVLHTFNPSKQEIDHYSYPRPGGKNAISVLKLVEVTLSSGMPIITEFVLAPQIAQYISMFEYITRVGWTKNGANVWVQILNREQRLSELVLISREAFIPKGENRQVSFPICLWKEKSETWINIKNTACFEFLPTPDDSMIKLIIVSEKSGFPHILLLEGTLPNTSSVTTVIAEPVWADLTVIHITFGDWSVLESKVWVNSTEGIVYFEGNRSSGLDKHLYAVDLSSQLPCSDPIQLTPTGYYHNTEVHVEQHLFVTSYSNQTTPPAVAVYSFSVRPFQVLLLFHVSNSMELPSSFTVPTNFTARASTGEELYGIVYPPCQLEAGKKYPTVLYVYGGPEFQVVKNNFSQFLMRKSQWIAAGFAVVTLDNRGSYNRGKKFESYIKDLMGNVELEDQVVGIQTAAQVAPYIDLSRVAIIGWSYGGYMALLGISKRPDVFKVAVSGAPVTDLMWYDTGYTERYLGIPPSKSYENSSVLSLASRFPNEPGRVLIIHGMSDENVLYTHTSLLIDALISHGKPYQVQLFTGERHGIRNPSASNHCDATILQFLLANL